MLTNSELKYFSSLLLKKNRQTEKKFIVEGTKLVEEGIKSDFICEIIFTTNHFAENNPSLISSLVKKKIRLEILKAEQFKKLADTDSPQGIAAIFRFSTSRISLNKLFDENMIIYLDNISDPGNLGTILRTADWFGVKNVLLSPGCVEIYNPKVLRASMGSVFHLNLIERFNAEKLNDFVDKHFSLICTDLYGKNLYEYNFPKHFVLIFSNEASGPSIEIQNSTRERITIPKFGKAESLNVASAFAVVMSYVKGMK